MEKIRKDQSTNCFPFSADGMPHLGRNIQIVKDVCTVWYQ